MTRKTVSTLSTLHIAVSMILLAAVPAVAKLTDMFVSQSYIALMFAVNICSTLLIMYNWPLVSRHVSRLSKNPVDTLIYTLIGLILTAFWTWFCLRFLKSELLIATGPILVGIGYARPGMLIAFSIMEAFMINIGFKNLTDHLDVRDKEFQAILLSAILFGFVMTLLFTPLNVNALLRTYPYWLILTAILSYLYNQSHSIVPGIISVTLVNLVLMIIYFLSFK